MKSASGFDEGAVEKFHYVHDFLAGVVNRCACAKLQHASGICGEDGLRFSALRVGHFVGQEIEGCFRLSDVVNAGGAAKEIGKRHFDEFD